MAATLTGEKELLRRLKQIDQKVAKKETRKAVNKSLRVLAKSIKAQIPPKHKQLKRAIGSRFAKDKAGANKGTIQAKVGAAVGIKKSKADAAAAEASAKRKKGRGVGLSARNIHWAILGTKARTQKKTGRSTGTMPAILKNIVIDGFAAGESAATAVLMQSLNESINKENHK